MVPDRAGADTRVDVTIPLSGLLAMDGASVIEDTWLRARAGEHGYLSGRDAEAIACDALIVPLVTGAPDWALIGQMITLVADAYAHAADARHGLPAPPGRPARPGRPQPQPQPQPQPPLLPLPPEQWQDLQYALARLAIQFVSGPGAVASALRRGLLGAPLNGKSVILDVGYADTIPESIRKAVIARDKGCAWPGGCDRRPAACDVHHVKHKRHGGKTSVRDCVCSASFIMTSASTGSAGKSSSCPTDPPAPPAPTDRRSCAATDHHRQPNPPANPRARPRSRGRVQPRHARRRVRHPPPKGRRLQHLHLGPQAEEGGLRVRQ